MLNFQGSLQNLAARRQGAILCQVNGGSRPKPSCLDRLKLFEHLKSSKIVPTLERYPMQKIPSVACGEADRGEKPSHGYYIPQNR